MLTLLSKVYKIITISTINHFLKGTHFFSVKRILLNSCHGIEIGERTRIVGPIFIPSLSKVRIGSDTWIGHDFYIEGNGQVCIGNYCDISHRCAFLTGSHNIGLPNRRAGVGFNGSIEINDSVWIGSNVIILPNISVGHSSVVGAGAVVTKNIRENTLAAGVPARIIKELGE